jgi:hypothetical protein
MGIDLLTEKRLSFCNYWNEPNPQSRDRNHVHRKNHSSDILAYITSTPNSRYFTNSSLAGSSSVIK